MSETNGKITWSILGVIAYVAMASVGAVWKAAEVIDVFQDADSLHDVQLATLEENSISTDDLIKSEHRITVLEEAIKDLKKDQHEESG